MAVAYLGFLALCAASLGISLALREWTTAVWIGTAAVWCLNAANARKVL